MTELNQTTVWQELEVLAPDVNLITLAVECVIFRTFIERLMRKLDDQIVKAWLIDSVQTVENYQPETKADLIKQLFQEVISNETSEITEHDLENLPY